VRLIRKGKVKDIYELQNGNLLFHFTDRISAFDIEMETPIPGKGEILCKFAEFWFSALGTNNHRIKTHDKDKLEVKKMEMIPIECVVRGFLYGGLFERYKQNETSLSLPTSFEPIQACKLPVPIFDPTTKSQNHDRPVSEQEIIGSGILSERDFEYLKEASLSLYCKMSEVVEKAGFILADVKFEFGRDLETTDLLLGDSLGPDEFRLWLKDDYGPGRVQKSYDKQILRDWLAETGFKDILMNDDKIGEKHLPPRLPASLVADLISRYSLAYEKISGSRL
jgi:phosphoribosylaminoimidazole-succinocarboxamide synthase